MTGEPTTKEAAEPPAALFISGDLMFASRVKAAAEAAGLTFRLAGSPPPLDQPPPSHLVLDLSTRAGATEAVVEYWKSNCPQAVFVAYGPHVQVGRLEAARAAGVPVVITRGQFDRDLSRLFRV